VMHCRPMPAPPRRKRSRRGRFPVTVPPGAIVSGFMPLKSEINPLPLMRKLSAAGAKLALPVVAGKGKPLIMRAFTFSEPAGLRRLGHPRAQARRAGGASRYPDRAAACLRPPRPAHRLRRRLLRHDHHGVARAKARHGVGIAFAAQQIAEVPTTPRDAPLDLVLRRTRS